MEFVFQEVTLSGIFDTIRVGSVPYLNARPLIQAHTGTVLLEVPSELAKTFAAGRVDAALLPVFELVKGSGGTAVDGVGIGCRGQVFSVFLAHRKPLAQIDRIFLDAASRTSVHLLQILLGEFHGWTGQFCNGDPGPNDARLLIGDPAIAFRRSAAASSWQFMDLGGEWFKQTGLPFVFACWVLRDELENGAAIADALRALKTSGMTHIDSIADLEADSAFARRYLKEFVRYDLDRAGRDAISLFASLLRKHNLADAGPMPVLTFV